MKACHMRKDVRAFGLRGVGEAGDGAFFFGEGLSLASACVLF